MPIFIKIYEAYTSPMLATTACLPQLLLNVLQALISKKNRWLQVSHSLKYTGKAYLNRVVFEFYVFLLSTFQTL